MTTRFIVDVTTGIISRQTEGVAVPDTQVGVITARDFLSCEVQFVAGVTTVTADVLSGARQVTLGLRQYPSYGALLAQSSNFVYDGTSDFATCDFDLNTSEVVALVDTLPTQARKTNVYFEIQTNEADGTKPLTVAQQLFALYCEVNEQGDVPPAAAADSANSAAASATAAANSASAAATSAASVDGPSIVSRDNARGPRQGLMFDGTATNGASFGALSSLLGDTDYTLTFAFRPSNLGSTDRRIIWCAANENQTLNVRYNPATLTFSSSNTGLSYVAPDNDLAHYAIARSGIGSGETALYRNGVLVQTYTDPNIYLSGSYIIAGSAAGLVGRVSDLLALNRAFSASEVQTIFNDGVPPAYDFQTGTGTNVNGSGYACAYGAADANVIGAVGGDDSGSVVAGTRTGGAGAYFGRLTATVVGNRYSTIHAAGWSKAARQGGTFLVRFWAEASVATPVSVYLRNGTTAAQSDTVSVGSVGTGWAQYEALVTHVPDGPLSQIYVVANHAAIGDTLDIDDLEVIPLGLLCAPDPQQLGAGGTWSDTSGNGADISLPASGVTWALPAGRFVGKGTTTNDNAEAGLVGEYVSASVASGSAVSLTTATAANVTSITLTAGDWDVTGQCDFTLTGASTTMMASGSSPTSATFDVQDSFTQFPIPTTTVTGEYDQVMPTRRVSIAATTIFYLVTKATFSAGTVKAFGTIRARRVR